MGVLSFNYRKLFGDIEKISSNREWSCYYGGHQPGSHSIRKNKTT